MLYLFPILFLSGINNITLDIQIGIFQSTELAGSENSLVLRQGADVTATETEIDTPDPSSISVTVSPSPSFDLTPTITSALFSSPTISITPTPEYAPTSTSVTTLENTPTTISTPDSSASDDVVILGEYMDGELLIKIESSFSSELIVSEFNSLGLVIGDGEMKRNLLEIGYLLVKVPPGSVIESIKQARLVPGVSDVQPNYLVYADDTIPNDTNWLDQYGLVSIRAPQGWDYSTGAAGVIIAIIDTGVDQSHNEFLGKIAPGYDFVNSDNDPQDDNGHGTHVAGIAAAIGNNGIGVAGVNWGANIMPVKVLSNSGGGTYARVAAGIVYAVDNNAAVINLSLGGSASPSTSVLQDAVNYAYSQGVTVVAASGNSGGTVLYPAKYDHVIAVAAVDSSNSHPSFSNSGVEVDVSAPGVSILSTSLGGSYVYRDGTSMAAPFVSGLAAIINGYVGMNPDYIEFVMESTALDLGVVNFDALFGNGLIQMDAALILVVPSSTPTSTPIVGVQNVSPTNTDTAASYGFGATVGPTITSTPVVIVTPTNTMMSMGDLIATQVAQGDESEVETQEKGGVGDGLEDQDDLSRADIFEKIFSFYERNSLALEFTCFLWLVVLVVFVVAKKREQDE